MLATMPTFRKIGGAMSTTQAEREAIRRQVELNRRSLSRVHNQTQSLRVAALRSERVVGQALKRLGYVK